MRKPAISALHGEMSRANREIVGTGCMTVPALCLINERPDRQTGYGPLFEKLPGIATSSILGTKTGVAPQLLHVTRA